MVVDVAKHVVDDDFFRMEKSMIAAVRRDVAD